MLPLTDNMADQGSFNGLEGGDPSLFHLLKEFNLYPTKALGQVFLDDRATVQAILEILNPGEKDLLIEIGAGPGLVTRRLALKAGRVIAVEIDRKFEVLHQKLFADLTSPPHMIYEDARKVEYQALLEDSGSRLLVFGNLPYYLTTDLILMSLNRFPSMDQALFMVEEEVRDRMEAKPGSKKYGTLAVASTLYGRWRYERAVSRTAFFPKPRVTSALMSLFPSDDLQKRKIGADESFHRFMTCLMQYRRKTLQNALRLSGLWKGDDSSSMLLGQFLERKGLSADIRAEQLAPDVLSDLFLFVSEQVIQ